MISTQRLSAATAGRVLFGDVDLVVDRGAVVAVTGDSGTGKSTLLRILNRLRPPDKGRVMWQGKAAETVPVRDYRRSVCLVPQTPVPLAATVADELRVGNPHLSDDVSAHLLEELGIGHLHDRDSLSLSGGELQRVCIARSLAVRPDVLLADEITSALDPDSRARVESVLRIEADRGLSVVMVSHDLEQVDRMADVRVHLERRSVDE